MNKEFITILLQKLRTGNTRLPHLNAIAGRYLKKIDLHSLRLSSDSLPVNVISGLLSGQAFECEVDMRIPNPVTLSTAEQTKHLILAKKLRNLQYDAKEALEEEGIRPLAIGYPILIKRSSEDPNKIIKAPLLIWSVDLVKRPRQSSIWAFIRRPEHAVVFNDILAAFLKTDQGVDISDLSSKIEKQPPISFEDVVTIAKEVVNRLAGHELSVEVLTTNPVVVAQPDDSRIIGTDYVPWISWSGVIGMFKVQKQVLATELDAVLDRIGEFKFDNLVVGGFQESSLTAFQTDPSQQEVIHQLDDEPRQIIQGPPGTGKSTSLTAVITNALSSGAKCLVVCEKKTALDIIRRNLKKLGLGELCTMIEDVSEDRKRVVESVRHRLHYHSTHHSSHEYDHLSAEVADRIQVVNRFHKRRAELLFNGQTWTQIVGAYLKSEREISWQALRYHISIANFDSGEYRQVTSMLPRAQRLFNETASVAGIVKELHPRFFSKNNPVTSRSEVEALAINLDSIASSLLKSVIQSKEDYRRETVQYFEQYFEILSQTFSDVHGALNEVEERFGPKAVFGSQGTKTKFILQGILFKRRRGFSKQEQHWRDCYSRFSDCLITEDQEWLALPNSTKLRVTTALSHLESAKVRVDGLLASAGERVESVWSEFDNFRLHASLLNHTRELDQIAKNLAEASHRESELMLFREAKLPAEATKLSLIAEWASSFRRTIEALQSSMHGFGAVHAWQHFLSGVSVDLRSLFEQIAIANPENWLDAYKSFYLHELLASNEIGFSDDPTDELEELKTLMPQVQQSVRARILDIWGIRQGQEVRRYSSPSEVNALYNLKGAPGERRNSLRKIVNADFDLFASFFPVLLVNPSVCAAMIPLKEGIFDVVIFDEASQLRLEDTFAALLRGQHKIVSGDNHQMPPSSYFDSTLTMADADDNEVIEEEEDQQQQSRAVNVNLAFSESLLDFAENAQYRKSYLEIHYRSRHPYLIDFSNAAFYGGRLVPMPPREEYTPIEFYEVNGLYEDQTNRAEAAKVVELLVMLGSQSKVPSVGVATFNIAQRNLILDLIEELETGESSEAITRLRDQKLFVKNLENIQGDERDILIFSTTFGQRRDGRFLQMFGPLTQNKGYRLLNVLITRAREKIMVCSSIPRVNSASYERAIKTHGNRGKGVLYAYLEYARAVSSKDEQARQQILSTLAEHCFESHKVVDLPSGSESPFEEEVAQTLIRVLGKERVILQHDCGGFRIDMVIKSKNNDRPYIAIEADGAKYHSSREAYLWDLFRQEQLEQFGFKFYRVWSTNWWRNREKEEERMIHFVRRMDEAEAVLY